MPEQARALEQAAISAVIAADRQRCHAVRDRDREKLSEVVSEDLTYRHSTGVVEGKADYLQTSVGGVPRTIERPGQLHVRIIGEVAVVTGDYIVRVDPSAQRPDGYVLNAEGLQVWVWRDARWQLLAHFGSAKQL